MTKIPAIIMILLCAGCTTVKTYNQQAQTFVDDLQNKKDPVNVVEVYKTEFICPELTNQEKHQRDGTQMLAWVYLFPFKLIYEITDEFMDFGTQRQYQCIKRDLLLEPDTKLDCANNYYENKIYNSDECVLYRRSEKFHESDVNYFDYKRFLGENSIIKNDADFLKLVKYYDKIAECDEQNDRTTTEKEECKEKRKTEMRALAMKKVPCNKLISEKYNEYITKQKEWFYWAQNHNPYAMVNTLRAVGEYEAARFAYSPVLSRSEALSTIKERMEEFGKENFCATDDWKQKMGIK